MISHPAEHYVDSLDILLRLVVINVKRKFLVGWGGRGIMEVLIELHGLVGIMKVIRKSATCYKIVPAKVKEKVLKETLAQDTQYCWN